MYMITAPIGPNLATVLEPYRQKYDPLANIAPAHIGILKPFEFSKPVNLLYNHLEEVGEVYAGIKVSLVGWDICDQRYYQLRLPLIAGRQEFISLRNNLLRGPLSRLSKADENYWPHIVFGRFSKQEKLAQAKLAIQDFEPQFTFRVNYIEFLYRNKPTSPWQIQKKFSLNATVAGVRRQKPSPKKRQTTSYYISTLPKPSDKKLS